MGEMTEGQLPLFTHPAAPPPQRPAATAGGVRYSRRGKTAPHRLCDDCTREIHVLGVARAPFPRPARWTRTTPDGDSRLLCDGHRAQRKEEEQ